MQTNSELRELSTEGLVRLLPGDNERRRAGEGRESISNVCGPAQFISYLQTASVGKTGLLCPLGKAAPKAMREEADNRELRGCKGTWPVAAVGPTCQAGLGPWLAYTREGSYLNVACDS